MRRVAPDAPGIANRQADEDAGQPGIGRFALDAAINLVNQKLAGRLVLKQGNRLAFDAGDDINEFSQEVGVPFDHFIKLVADWVIQIRKAAQASI